MKKIKIIFVLLLASSFLYGSNFKGSGASFPYSVYQAWIKAYYNDKGVEIDYIKKGSSEGIKDITNRNVNFAGSDKPLSPKDLKQRRLYQFPAVVGAITISFNIPKINKLKISRLALAQIALGKIKYWDNPLLTKQNPKLVGLHKKLTFVRRSDGSGTTFNFTYYLSKISSTWRNEYGAKKSLSWPGDNQIGGKTNTGVAALIKQIPYSVGYVDYADAKSASLNMASLENRAKKFISPKLKNFQIAASKATLDAKKDFYSVIADPSGAKSYPIIAATFILLPKEHPNMDKKVIKFYSYSYSKGAKLASKLGYVPLPSSLVAKIKKYWKEKGL